MTLYRATAAGPVPMTPDEEAEFEASRAPQPPTREQLKTVREATVSAITVTVGGKVFDGDEVSQGRMARALLTASITGQTTCTWVLHDNTSVTVTKAELEIALALAMQAQAEVWVIS
jgi:hypothetical protein